MQATLDLVWEKLLPAMRMAPQPADREASEKLTRKLSSLAVHAPSGKPSSPLSASVSGKRFVFPFNDRQIEAVSLEFKSDGALLSLRTSSGESRIACSADTWRKGRSFFVNGPDKRMAMPSELPVAASGAWTAEDTYTVKLCFYQTPFSVTLIFRFKGDQLFFDSEYGVGFGPTTPPQMVGHTP